jgi:transcriptional regulator with XRE-family HTH domain
MHLKGWGQADLAREAKVDPATVSDFLSGARWPQLRTQGKLETALGLPLGEIASLGADAAPTPEVVPTSGHDEPYAADGGPPIRDATLDELLAEVARRARDNNPDAQ